MEHTTVGIAGRPSPENPTAEHPEAFPGLLRNVAWQALVTSGVVATAVGVLVLAWPGSTLLTAGALFGAYLIVYGITQLVSAFGAHVPGGMRALLLVSGVVSVLLGLTCFRNAAQSILLLALWIGFGWLMRGITMTVTAVSATGFPGRGWNFFLGTLTMLGGVVLVVSPFASIAALTLASGCWLIAIGVAEAAHGIRLRSHMQPTS